MAPALRSGDGLVALRSRRIRRGQLRCFEHPKRPGFWMVKRVGRVYDDRFEALSDKVGDEFVDSRTFGDVPIDGSYRVVFRVSGGR